MNSTIEERVRFVEKEGLFTCLAEEKHLPHNITAPRKPISGYNAPPF
jgi:hypothetical protein